MNDKITKVIVHSLMDESLNFTGSKFNRIQPPKKLEILRVHKNESNECFNKQTNAQCDKYLESTECEMNKGNASLRDAHVNEVVTERADVSSKNLVQTECSISKVLTKTKTTVIKTFNLVTHSRTKKALIGTGMDRLPWSSNPKVMTEDVDKSRVVVQVLKSDVKSKTQNVIEKKSPNSENQSDHSFRDDLCKLLSKSQLLCNVDNADDKEYFPGSGTLHVADTIEDNSSSESQNLRTGNVKTRRKRNLNFYFWNGRGEKVGDLKCVCDNLQKASLTSLRYLHYLMFSYFTPCGTALQLLEMQRNIKNFCGYPFKKSSEQFEKKLKCISKIPGPMLIGIHRAIFGKTSFLDRSVMIDQVINFLLLPRKCSEMLKKYDDKSKYNISEDVYDTLKKSALRGQTLSVVLKRLPENVIRKHTSDIMETDCEMPAYLNADLVKSTEIEHDSPESSRTLPAFILNGPGTKLKFIHRVSKNVRTVNEEPIKILHYILYGRIEHNIKDCRRNILEFNGFSECQQEFAAERKEIIKKLNQRELFEICKILCLRAKTCSREMRMKKILKYLQSPSKLTLNKVCGASQRTITNSSESRHQVSNIPPYKVYETAQRIISNSSESHHHLNTSVSNISSYKGVSASPYLSDEVEVFCSDNGWKLRNFKTICSNIECAAPPDLIELNDLLFLKTCDEPDIHQKILDFSGFSFLVNSIHYDYRKTLMHYMGFCVIKKIARLLNIENWEMISNPDDLSSNVLKFLMISVEQGVPCSIASSPSPCKSVMNSNVVTKPPSPSSSKSVIASSDAGSSLPTPLQPCSDTNPDQPKSLKSQFVQSESQDFNHRKGKLIIERLTKASVQAEAICQSQESNESVQILGGDTLNLHSINSSGDDSICLRDLLHHPSDQELKDLIFHIIKGNMWSCTLGDLVEKVYVYYPKINLSYRENFIKASAREMVAGLREYAISTVKDQII